MRGIIIGLAMVVSGAATAKEPRPEYDWRLGEFFACADGQIDRLKQSRDEASAILTAVLLACEDEKRGVIQIGTRLYEVEHKTKIAGRARRQFEAEGEARLRELTLSRIVTTRAR